MLPIGWAIWCRRFEPGLFQGFSQLLACRHLNLSTLLMNFLPEQCPNIYNFFVWITACHGRVHEKRPKETEETEFRLKNKENRQKAGLKPCSWALIGTNRDELAFLGCRAGRWVSVSKSGLSQRDRDGWQKRPLSSVVERKTALQNHKL